MVYELEVETLKKYNYGTGKVQEIGNSRNRTGEKVTFRVLLSRAKKELENLDILSKGDRMIMNFRAFELKKHDLNLNIDNVNL